jgi:hypothetical protein
LIVQKYRCAADVSHICMEDSSTREAECESLFLRKVRLFFPAISRDDIAAT